MGLVCASCALDRGPSDTDIVGLIYTVFITIFYLLPLFFVPVFIFHASSAFCV